MYRLIILISTLAASQTNESMVFLNYDKSGDDQLISVSKKSYNQKTYFTFNYADRTEKFISQGAPVPFPADSLSEIQFQTPLALRKKESAELKKNIEKAKEGGKLRVLLSINELFEEIYLIEQIGEGEYLKHMVYWDD